MIAKSKGPHKKQEDDSHKSPLSFLPFWFKNKPREGANLRHKSFEVLHHQAAGKTPKYIYIQQIGAYIMKRTRETADSHRKK